MTALVFETTLAIVGSLNLSKLSAAPNGLRHLHTAYLLLNHVRIVCLVSSLALLYKVPAREKDCESSAQLLSAPANVDQYGTVDASSKARTPSIDAQSTNWLDYLVGFTRLFPLLW
jgi:hypothetical protein